MTRRAAPLLRLPRLLLAGLREARVAPEQVAAAAGLRKGQLGERLGAGQADAFLAAAHAAVPDPSFALRLGARARPELYGLVGVAAMSAEDLGAGLASLGRSLPLVCGVRFSLAPGGAGVALRLEGPADDRPHARARVECQLASLVSFARRFTAANLLPLGLTLRAPAPPHRALHEELFGCEVQFGAPHDQLLLAPDDLALPLQSRNPDAARLAAARLEWDLARLARSGGAAERVREAVRRRPSGAPPSLGAVALELGLTARSLQRHLRAEGLRFQQLVDEVLTERALRALAAGERDTFALARSLGFSGAAPFFRAFKRWTGRTPEQWRASRRPPG